MRQTQNAADADLEPGPALPLATEVTDSSVADGAPAADVTLKPAAPPLVAALSDTVVITLEPAAAVLASRTRPPAALLLKTLRSINDAGQPAPGAM